MRELKSYGCIPLVPIRIKIHFSNGSFKYNPLSPCMKAKPLLLLVDDDPAVRVSLKLLFTTAGYEMNDEASPEAALSWLNRRTPDLIIIDMNFRVEASGEEGLQLLKQLKQQLPNVPVILITGWGTIALAVEGMKLGAAEFITKPWQNEQLLQVVQTQLELVKETQPVQQRSELDQSFQFGNIIGQDQKLLQVLQTITRVAKTDAPVLILGESGTGKELIAEAIHQNSQRSSKPFVKVNLGGISTSLFESEMFGHKKGAFTDARTDRTGRFELAEKGSIFLDEIGDLDLASQVKLLRVLQDRTYEVLGSSKSQTADVRVICATNKNLEEMVANAQFREDLYYRINLISLHLPSLNQRPGDIPLLAEAFVNNLRTIYQRPKLHISPEALKWLEALPLPGNIRQLKNLVERTVLLSQHDTLQIDDFKQQLQPIATAATGQLPKVGALTLEQMEVAMIERALHFHNGKVSNVARSLGLTRSALYRRLDKFGIAYNP